MGFALGIVVFVLGLLVSIALHEVGHMVPAKRFGVRVSRYMVGFGPTLWSRTRGETEYGLKAIPLGGYVRLVGMLPPAEAVGARRRPGRMAEIVDAAREASAEEVLPGEEHRAFYRLSAPKKVVVMLGGPFMNLVIAVVLMAVVLVGVGLPGSSSTTTVAYVAPCIYPLDAQPGDECTAQDPVTPAARAGLQPGDRLLELDGRPTATWEDFTAAVRASDGSAVPLVVERDGERVPLEIAPVLTERPVVDDDGAVVVEDGEVVTEPTRFVGVTPAAALEREPLSAVPAVVGTMTWETAKIVLTLPVRVWEIGEVLLTGADRDATGVVGIVGVGRLAGELGTAETPYGAVGNVSGLLSLLASLNIALFVFNLIPLLPLDGGHVVGALWEGAKRQWARVRGLPRPAPADVARMMPLAYGVFAVLGLLAVFLVVADVVRPVTI